MKNTKLTSSDHLRRAFPFLLLAVYGVFLCSYFIFNDYSKPYQFYARVVFIPSLFVVVGSIRNVWKHPLFQMIVAYLLYLLLSGFWSDPLDWYGLGQKATIAVNLISFIAVTYFLVQWNPSFFEYMLQACALFAAAAAVISIVVFYGDNSFPTTRLTPIGSLTNINEFSNVYGIFALLAAFFVMQFPGRKLNWVFIFSIGAFICVAWFGQSRTAFTAMIIALLTLVSLMQKNKRLLCLVALAALAGLLVVAFPEVVGQLFERGPGLRPLIWAAVWDEAQSAPVFGHGLASTLSVGISGYTFETAHNAFLMLFWQGGAVGVMIFLLLLVVAFRHAWSLGQQQGDFSIFCILIFAVCTMMTGVDTLIERPRDQWMLFWFPLALLISYRSNPSPSGFYNPLTTAVRTRT